MYAAACIGLLVHVGCGNAYHAHMSWHHCEDLLKLSFCCSVWLLCRALVHWVRQPGAATTCVMMPTWWAEQTAAGMCGLVCRGVIS
jgi:hypothetical protein